MDQNAAKSPANPPESRGHRKLSLRLALLAAAMFGFGYLLVPIYYTLCQITGIGPQASQANSAPLASDADPSRNITVEFISSVNEFAPWEFHPDAPSAEVHPGQVYTARFFARNLTDRVLVGQAVPSITPGDAAKHLHKLDCFCFRQQQFEPKEGRELVVRFYLDGQFPTYVDRLTLSYTFFDTHRTVAQPAPVRS
jgi:cytochrome c oxidase assembly protein subunit 11